MNTAKSMYACSLAEATDAIYELGNKLTIILQGHMGVGKSAVGFELDKRLSDHTYFYCDCTTKDMGDLMLPRFKDVEGGDCVRFVTNEELGLHLQNQKVIINLDEIGKANPSVKNAVLRLMYERRMGNYVLHPESIVFATTNKGGEGVGDILPPHARNRVTVMQIRKSTNMEWVEWGINKGIEPSILGYAKDNPQIFFSYEDVKNPEDNPYIFHPNQQRDAFITPRSLETASHWVTKRNKLTDNALTMGLMGTIGERGAMDLMAYVKLIDQMPTREEIMKDPNNAKIPSSSGAVVMVVFRSLASMDKDYLNPFMDYLVRLEPEAQAMFANGVRAKGYHAQSLVMTNKKFTEWSMKNQHLYQADKK